MAIDAHLSTYPATAAWSFVNEASPDSLVLTTAGDFYPWAGATVFKTLGYGSYDDTTGLYTVEREGFYSVDFDANFDPSEDAGLQSVGIQVDGEAAYHNGMVRYHPAATTGRYAVSCRGLTLHLTAGNTIALAFSSDTNADTQSIYSAAVRIQLVQSQLGTAV